MIANELVVTLTADIVRAARRRGEPGLVIGLAGAQGSGKTTLVAALECELAGYGLRAASLSLDDLYLSREARLELGRRVHPLLAVRGPPGTHDPARAVAVLRSLARPAPTPVPQFDKALDTTANDLSREGPLDVILFEGWCVGARPQPEADLLEPVNALERDEDSHVVWRRYVNAALGGAYQALFGCIDHLVLLRPPSFDVVVRWRTEQEHGLRAKLIEAGRDASGLMSDAEIERFVALYERLTRWLITEASGRADMLIDLDAERRPTIVRRFRDS